MVILLITIIIIILSISFAFMVLIFIIALYQPSKELSFYLFKVIQILILVGSILFFIKFFLGLIINPYESDIYLKDYTLNEFIDDYIARDLKYELRQ